MCIKPNLIIVRMFIKPTSTLVWVSLVGKVSVWVELHKRRLFVMIALPKSGLLILFTYPNWSYL
jgi:hypothetical protein